MLWQKGQLRDAASMRFELIERNVSQTHTTHGIHTLRIHEELEGKRRQPIVPHPLPYRIILGVDLIISISRTLENRNQSSRTRNEDA